MATATVVGAQQRLIEGQATYARRKAIIEPVFGQMQTVQQAKRLLLRGTDAARSRSFRAGDTRPRSTPSSAPSRLA